MKASIILIAFLIIISFGCKSNKAPADISGTYITQFKNEYYNTEDTIIIKADGSANASFNIERKTGFKKISQDNHDLKKFKYSKWNASYDSDNHLLKETELGRQIYFNAEKKALKLGDSEYQKVK